MSESISPEDPMSAAFRLGFQAGARAVREAVSWDTAQAAGLDADLNAVFYGAIRDILGGLAPSPFASSAGGRADA